MGKESIKSVRNDSEEAKELTTNSKKEAIDLLNNASEFIVVVKNESGMSIINASSLETMIIAEIELKDNIKKSFGNCIEKIQEEIKSEKDEK